MKWAECRAQRAERAKDAIPEPKSLLLRNYFLEGMASFGRSAGSGQSAESKAHKGGNPRIFEPAIKELLL